MNRFYQGQKVTITGDRGIGAFGRPTLDPIPDGEVCTVCDDFGRPIVEVFRGNGQLRKVARECVRP